MAGRDRGASLDQAVEHALERSGPEGLCPPRKLAEDALDGASVDALAVWGVFNPFGSSRVRLLSVEAAGARLLVQVIEHARHPRAWCHGLLGDEPLLVLRELFGRRANEGEEPVMPAPATHVDLTASQLSETELRALLCGALSERDDLDLVGCCELIERHGADVAERTKDELRGALNTVMDIQAGVHRKPGRPSAALLSRWWALVTDSALGAGERAAIDELGGSHLSVRPPIGEQG